MALGTATVAARHYDDRDGHDENDDDDNDDDDG